MDRNALHQEHREWLSQLDFYQDEIKIFQNELCGVIQQHPDYLHMIEHVDEYRSILLRKLQRIDDLRHTIMLHERQLVKEEPQDEHEHDEVRSTMEHFVQAFESMKANFRRFVSRNN
jgi:hypothetical protein